MSTELAEQIQGGWLEPVDSKFSTPEVVKEMATGRAFTPQIRVIGSNNNIVKEGKYTGVGTFALVEGAGTKYTNYGTELVSLIVAWRPRAICYGPYSTSFNPKNEEYQKILTGYRAGGANNKNAVGPEFLIWLCDHGHYAEFFHGGISLETEGALAVGIFDEQKAKKAWIPVSFKIDLAKKKASNQMWHTSRCTRYTSEVPASKFPNLQELAVIRERFNNPKEANNGEAAETTDTGADGHVR
jgi:hypothetical protein